LAQTTPTTWSVELFGHRRHRPRRTGHQPIPCIETSHHLPVQLACPVFVANGPSLTTEGSLLVASVRSRKKMVGTPTTRATTAAVSVPPAHQRTRQESDINRHSCRCSPAVQSFRTTENTVLSTDKSHQRNSARRSRHTVRLLCRPTHARHKRTLIQRSSCRVVDKIRCCHRARRNH